MCANAGPAEYNYDETVSTLRFVLVQGAGEQLSAGEETALDRLDLWGFVLTGWLAHGLAWPDCRWNVAMLSRSPAAVSAWRNCATIDPPPLDSLRRGSTSAAPPHQLRRLRLRVQKMSDCSMACLACGGRQCIVLSCDLVGVAGTQTAPRTSRTSPRSTKTPRTPCSESEWPRQLIGKGRDRDIFVPEVYVLLYWLALRLYVVWRRWLTPNKISRCIQARSIRTRAFKGLSCFVFFVSLVAFAFFFKAPAGRCLS